MAFIVEDGTGKADANSYVSVGTADLYFTERGMTTWVGSVADKQSALVRATDYIDLRFGSKFAGCKATAEQALCFPRKSNVMPIALVKATAEYAMRALGGKALLADPVTDETGNRVKSTSKKLGPMEKKIEYMEGTSATAVKAYPAADLLIATLLRKTTGGTYR